MVLFGRIAFPGCHARVYMISSVHLRLLSIFLVAASQKLTFSSSSVQVNTAYGVRLCYALVCFAHVTQLHRYLLRQTGHRFFQEPLSVVEVFSKQPLWSAWRWGWWAFRNTKATMQVVPTKTSQLAGSRRVMLQTPVSTHGALTIRTHPLSKQMQPRWSLRCNSTTDRENLSSVETVCAQGVENDEKRKATAWAPRCPAGKAWVLALVADSEFSQGNFATASEPLKS